MAGQGFHLGLAKMIADQQGRSMSAEMRTGVLLVDALNCNAGGRRCTHFTGGAGCVVPRYNELRQVSRVQSWDSGFKQSYLVDPRIDMRLFEAASVHLPEGDYKDGIRIHLLADKYYDHLVQQVIFDISRQKCGIIVDKATGREMTGAEFRKAIYAIYPLLDQAVMEMAGIDSKEVDSTKELLGSVFTDEMATFICKYLNFHPELQWEDTEFFKLEQIKNLIDTIVNKTINYLSR